MTCFYKNSEATILLNEEITLENANEITDFIYAVGFMDEITDIHVIINSGGGSVMGGWNIFNALINSDKVVKTTISGICASIASIIFLSGQQRKMYNYGLFMIHNPSNGDDKILSLIKDSLKKILSMETFVDLSDLMDNETWFESDEMVEMDIIKKDNIIEINKEKIMKKELKANKKSVYELANSILNEKFKDEIKEVKNAEEMIKEDSKKTIEDEIEIEIEKEVEPEMEETKTEDSPMTMEELKTKIMELEKENEMLKSENIAKNEYDELVEKCTNLEKENSDIKMALNKTKTEEELKQKEEILNKFNITDKSKWISLDIETIKSLAGTLSIKSPKIEIENDKTIDFKNMSSDEKKELMINDPKLYTELFLKTK